jgi:hypothetical protein
VELDKTSPSATATSPGVPHSQLTNQTPTPSPTNIHYKFSPLLDPVRYLSGKYGGSTMTHPIIATLPSPGVNKTDLFEQISTTYTGSEERVKYIQRAVHKIHEINNSSFVDAFFVYLTSQLCEQQDWIHGVKYYGSYLAIQRKFRFNLYDDASYLRQFRFFNEQLGKCFHVYDQTFLQYIAIQTKTSSSRKNHRKKLVIDGEKSFTKDETDLLLEIEDIDGEETGDDEDAEDAGDAEMDVVSINSQMEIHSKTHNHDIKNRSTDSDYISDADSDPAALEDSDEDDMDADIDNSKISGSDDMMDLEDDYMGDEEEPQVDNPEREILYSYLDNYPVQMICMERCENTMDYLFTNCILHPGNYDTEGASMMFQVVAMLAVYQKLFDFTHNDLHTDNIMWISTNIPHLTYTFDGVHYKVPTYGRIFKLIDFGRSIFWFKGHLFCSDSFAEDGDAATQYNFPPFYDQRKPTILPNPSFDLCRLACSMYDLVTRHDESVVDFDLDDDYDDSNSNEDDESSYTTIDENAVEEIEADTEEQSHSQTDDSTEQESLFVNFIHKLCKDDKGKHMLYKKSGEERYPYFRLYQMIARTVHNHIPKDQFQDPLFAQFRL